MENSINPGLWQTYLFVRHTTLLVLAVTLELSESQYNTPLAEIHKFIILSSQFLLFQHGNRVARRNLWIPVFTGMTDAARAVHIFIFAL